jgi:hypothetical protein
MPLEHTSLRNGDEQCCQKKLRSSILQFQWVETNLYCIPVFFCSSHIIEETVLSVLSTSMLWVLPSRAFTNTCMVTGSSLPGCLFDLNAQALYNYNISLVLSTDFLSICRRLAKRTFEYTINLQANLLSYKLNLHSCTTRSSYNPVLEIQVEHEVD